jgi:putative phage-type endonuclease
MMQQYSDEWWAERLGKATASRISDIIASTKTGWGASRANYEAELIAERLTGETGESFTNAAMQWGTDTEPEARAAYEFMNDAEVTEVGFITHPTIAMSGASPDGLVGDEGMVEIKCPKTATHLATLLGSAIPKKYTVQMQWQMACADRLWCDFVSFDPRLPARHQLFIKRVDRDNEMIADLESKVSDFLAEVNAKIEKLEART